MIIERGNQELRLSLEKAFEMILQEAGFENLTTVKGWLETEYSQNRNPLPEVRRIIEGSDVDDIEIGFAFYNKSNCYGYINDHHTVWVELDDECDDECSVDLIFSEVY